MTCLADKTNHPVKRPLLLVGTLSACIQPEYWIQLPREHERGRGMPSFPKICAEVWGPPKCPSFLSITRTFNCFRPARVSPITVSVTFLISPHLTSGQRLCPNSADRVQVRFCLVATKQAPIIATTTKLGKFALF